MNTLIQRDIYTPMFTTTLSIKAKTQKQPKCPVTEKWIKDMVNVHNGILLCSKNNEIMPSAAKWMDLEIIILSEVRERQIPPYHLMWSLIKMTRNKLRFENQTYGYQK